jgi:hypothetical protein
MIVGIKSNRPTNKSMQANCYATFNKKWLGLRRRVDIVSSFAGPQSRDFGALGCPLESTTSSIVDNL